MVATCTPVSSRLPRRVAHRMPRGMVTPNPYYMLLPLIAMTFASLGGMTRYTRAAMSEALSLDCIRLEGLS